MFKLIDRKCIICEKMYIGHYNSILCSDICKLKRQFYKNQISFLKRKYKNFKPFAYNINKGFIINF